MKLSGYIIEKYNNMASAYTCHRLISEAASMGIDLRMVGVHDTIVDAQGVWNNGELLPQRDFVINRFKYGKVKEQINQLGRRSYNNIALFDRYINKYEQVKTITSSHFAVPRYMLSTALAPYDTIVAALGTPFVAKGLERSMGEEVMLIENNDDYTHLSSHYSHEKEWLFEEFIGSSYGRDLRIFTLRDKAVACMMRKSVGDFRANVALGATVETVEVTPLISNIIADIYHQTHLDFMGVDLLYGPDKYYFCEVNVMPGIEGIELASGMNIARKIIETIKNDFENE